MPWEITFFLLMIMIFIVMNNHKKKALEAIEETWPAVVLNKDIERRMHKLHYFCAFRINDEKTTIFEISEKLYYELEIGVKGYITYKHHAFIKFRVENRDEKLGENQDGNL